MMRSLSSVSLAICCVACGPSASSSGSDTASGPDWWEDGGSGGAPADDAGFDGDDDDEDDDDDDLYAELLLFAEAAPTDGFSGTLGVEGFDGTTSCFALFGAEGAPAEPCPGCTTTLQITLGAALETEGDCSTLDGLPVSASGESVVLGWASTDRVQVQTETGWSLHWAEMETQDGEWALFVDLLDAEDDNDE